MAHHLVLPFQRELPVNLVRYRIKPLPVPGYRMRTHVFNATSQPEVSNDKAGYTLIQVRRLPAVRAEPFMPHEMTVGAWMFLHYADSDWDLPEPQFWAKWAKEQSEATSRQLRLNGDLTKAAQEAVAGAATPADKVYALVRFVRQRVRRDTRSDGSNESARDTLRRGTGSGDDAVVLFTALARAAGLEAHLARMPDREIFVAAPRLKQPYFLTRLTTAIKIGTGWTFVDAANEQAPGGQLRWQQEGVYALVLDGAATFLAAGISSRDTSQVRRTGTLRLMANGDLEGDLAVVYSGHLGTRHREQADDQTLAEQERQFTQRLTTYLPRASVTSFRIENLDDPDKAYVVRFSLTVPGFAQSTGTRLRVTTAVLPRELTPAFAATTRTRPVIFPFAWSEVDAFTIQLPDGYEVESMNTPPPVAMPEDAGRLDVAIALSGQSLTYNRSFGFGRSTVAYPVEGYPALKKFFDEARKADGAGVLLRRKGDGNAR
jgi:transglutaminase-like putative cysteine protease